MPQTRLKGDRAVPPNNTPVLLEHEPVSCLLVNPQQQLRRAANASQGDRAVRPNNTPVLLEHEPVSCLLVNPHQHLSHAADALTKGGAACAPHPLQPFQVHASTFGPSTCTRLLETEIIDSRHGDSETL